MADKLIISFDEYTKIVEKLAIQIHNNFKPTVLVGIMRGASTLSRVDLPAPFLPMSPTRSPPLSLKLTP